MTHQEIEEKGIIERYVLRQLDQDERRAFQEHYFACDECFERAQMEARFVAGVREASRSGVLAADQTHSPHFPNRPMAAAAKRAWFDSWLVPALAAALVVALALTGLWALSLRRENRLLAERAAQQDLASELQRLEEKVRNLEAGDSALQQQRQSFQEEINRLKEQMTEAERRHETELAQLREPDVNVPVRNIYPIGDPQRSGRANEINRVHIPHGTRAFVLILSDYKPGYTDYLIEISDPSGRLVTRRQGLKPDQAGDLSVLLNRTLVGQGKYRLKLYGQQQLIAEYVIQVE